MFGRRCMKMIKNEKSRLRKLAKNTAYLLAYAIDVFLIGIEIAAIILWISTSFNSINAIYRWLRWEY